jgi:hypothetical protein
MAALSGLLALGGTFVVSCDDKGVEPTEQVDPNALTEEQKLFVSALDPTNQKLIDKGWVMPSILDGKPVVYVPVNPVPNNLNFTEAFQGFMDIEIRLIDAKTGSYSITPIINRSSVEKILKKAEELEPGKIEYGVSFLTQALNSSGVKRDLTPGLFITDKDDNNPATNHPNVGQLNERFTFLDIANFNPYTSLKSNTFTINKRETFKIGLSPATVGVEFDVINYLVSPINDAQSIVNN